MGGSRFEIGKLWLFRAELFDVFKKRIFCRKIYVRDICLAMALFNEINRLQEKINRIAPQVSPSELKMHIFRAGEEVLENNSRWEMSVYVEGKEESWTFNSQNRPIHRT